MADEITRVHFNNGEGIEEGDFNRLQSLLDVKLLQRAANIGALGGALEVGNSTGSGDFTAGGAELGQRDPRTLEATKIFVPSPLGFVNSDCVISGAGSMTFGYGPQHIIQGSGGSTPGTLPTGGSGRVLSYVSDDDEMGWGAIARPTVNNRWDSYGIRLGHETPDNTESRDVEDAATRAVTTQLVAKDQPTSFEHELVQGTEAASPVVPAHTAGYARFATVLRETGETSFDRDNFRLHTFPLKFKVETVMGTDAWSTGFQDSAVRPGAIEKNGAGSGTATFFSRRMHAGCRLVGIGVGFQNVALDVDDIQIQRATYGTTGILSMVELVNLGGGSPIGSTAEGFNFAGLPEFLDSDGIELPIWGNGRTHGPLFGNHGASTVETLADDLLALSISHGSWSGGEDISYVKFFYLE